MKIIGIHFTEISAEKISQLKGALEINSNLDIEDIKKEEMNVSKISSLIFDFNYLVSYNPNMAKIRLKGQTVVFDDQNESENILKEWKKKKFEHSMKIPLLNFILAKCSMKSIQLADELGLPPHVNLPQITPDSKEAVKNSKHAVKDSKNSASYTG